MSGLGSFDGVRRSLDGLYSIAWSATSLALSWTNSDGTGREGCRCTAVGVESACWQAEREAAVARSKTWNVRRGKTGRHVSRASRPTPIQIPPRAGIALVIAIVLLLALLLWAAPSVLTVALGGSALALLLSFPVGLLSRAMPRWMAIFITVLVLVGMITVALVFLVPVLSEQLVGLISSAPAIAAGAERFVNGILEPLQRRGLLLESPEVVTGRLAEGLIRRIEGLASDLVSGTVEIISITFGFAVQVVGVIFIAIYLLADIRNVKAAFLRAAPHRYRGDALELWESFGASLSRYLGGLALVIVIQGALSSFILWILGIPYPLVLGAWVSAMAIIPYLGAFLGAIPALILALLQSPTVAIVTGLAFLGIQQLEGNVLTPRIQGHAVRIHPVIVLLAVIAAGELAGIVGIIFAVPTLAFLRVLIDFFGARLEISGISKDTEK